MLCDIVLYVLNKYIYYSIFINLYYITVNVNKYLIILNAEIFNYFNISYNSILFA